MVHRSTSTSAFGVSNRESHDASGFYSRFTPPDLSSDASCYPDKSLDKLIQGDARSMSEVEDASVALVVTSPPYFAGKEYEEALGEGGVPATYFEYLELLREVFSECVRTLEPGGRIAVNVANLGRRPYRSLSADVIRILQDDLRLMLRGEIIWLKQRGSTGSCAWGSFQRAANPVLRDLTERVVIASKGRFDRAIAAPKRRRAGLPSESTMTREDFMENTLDVWEIPPESATRVGHPAPFPVELPARLIDLYTYRGDLVLDPFAGSGSAALAALRTGRHFVGYDLDEAYIRLAEARLVEERQRLVEEATASPGEVTVSALRSDRIDAGDPRASAVRDGKTANEIARAVLVAAGFTDLVQNQHQGAGVVVSLCGRDGSGARWLFDVPGSFTSHRGGLRRPDIFWKALGKAAVLREVTSAPLVLLATDLPSPGSTARHALELVCGPDKPIFGVIEMLDVSAPRVLRDLCLRQPTAMTAPRR